MEKLFIELDEKTGEAFFDGIACEVTNRYYHADLQRGFESIIGKPAWTIMSRSAFYSGTILAQEIMKRMKGKSRQDIIKKVLWNISARGFGAPEIIYIDDEEKTITVSVRNSYNTMGYGDVASPVCHALGGLICGMFSVIMGEECECTEKECSMMGAESCVFELVRTGKKIKPVRPLKPKSGGKKLVKKEIKHDQARGEIFFDGVSSSIVMLGRTGIFQREFEKTIGPTSRSIIYNECKETTKKAVGTLSRTFVRMLGRLTTDMAIKKLIHQIPERGWGRSELVDIDKKACKVTIRVRNCFNHLYYGRVRRPVCYSLASIIAGGAEIIFDRDMVCTETRCEALGDPYCEFSAKPSKKKQ
jgi:predicted hydrocarbon binding protein